MRLIAEHDQKVIDARQAAGLGTPSPSEKACAIVT